MSHMITICVAVFCISLFDMHARSQQSLGVLKSWTLVSPAFCYNTRSFQDSHLKKSPKFPTEAWKKVHL